MDAIIELAGACRGTDVRHRNRPVGGRRGPVCAATAPSRYRLSIDSWWSCPCSLGAGSDGAGMKVERGSQVTLKVSLRICARTLKSSLTRRRQPSGVSAQSSVQLPTTSIRMVAPRVLSLRRRRPRHKTMFPGGGSLARARWPPSRAISLRWSESVLDRQHLQHGVAPAHPGGARGDPDIPSRAARRGGLPARRRARGSARRSREHRDCARRGGRDLRAGRGERVRADRRHADPCRRRRGRAGGGDTPGPGAVRGAGARGPSSSG